VDSPVILASASPRRAELLNQILRDFEVHAPAIDESLKPGEHPRAAAERLALEKAKTIAGVHPEALVLGSDTVVWIPDSSEFLIFGKPRGPEDALRMLRRLSGKRHFVTTAVAIVDRSKEIVESETVEVVFRKLTDQELAEYVHGDEPLDKAGAYGIQGKASEFVQSINGPIDAVIGLPLERTQKLLRAFGKKEGDLLDRFRT